MCRVDSLCVEQTLYVQSKFSMYRESTLYIENLLYTQRIYCRDTIVEQPDQYCCIYRNRFGTTLHTGYTRQAGTTLHTGYTRQSGTTLHTGYTRHAGTTLHTGYTRQTGTTLHTGYTRQSGSTLHTGYTRQAGTMSILAPVRIIKHQYRERILFYFYSFYFTHLLQNSLWEKIFIQFLFPRNYVRVCKHIFPFWKICIFVPFSRIESNLHFLTPRNI